MAANTLKLPDEDNSLVIETNTEAWARCYLVQPFEQERIYLGADVFPIVATRLHDGLNQWDALNKAVDGELQGHYVMWLLSLCEVHHVLYAAQSGPDRLLFWQNADVSFLLTSGVMRLSPERCVQWQEVLSAALDTDKMPGLTDH